MLKLSSFLIISLASFSAFSIYVIKQLILPEKIKPLLLSLCLLPALAGSILAGIFYENHIAVFHMLTFFSLFILSYTDATSHSIHTGMLIAVGILAILSLWFTEIPIIDRLIGAAIAGIPLFLLNKWRGGIGTGDIILLTITGFMLGTTLNIAGMLVGFLLAAIAGVVLNIVKKQNKIALVPWLSVGISAALLIS